MNRTNNSTSMWAVCVTVTAATDTEAFNPVLLAENGAFAQQAVTDGSPGVNSVRYAGAYYGGAAPPPAGAASTLLHSNDAGAYGWSSVRETTAGQGSRLVGFTQGTSDDRAGVHLAVREAQPPSLPGFLDTTWVEPESHCDCRPIIDGNGNRYRIAESNLARGNHPLMGKSADGGITWAEQDATGSDARTTQDLEGTWVLKDGTSFMAMSTRDDTVWLDEFRMSDHATNPDTWGLEETVDSALSSSGVIQACSFVRLSDGTYQMFYSDLLNGANNQIGYKKRTGTNTYSSKTTFDDGAVNVTAPKAVVGENDVTYVFYKDNTGDSLVYRTVTAAGTVSARTTVASGSGISSDTISHTNPVYYDDGGVEVIGIAYLNDSDILKYRELRDGVLQTEETISTAAVTTNPGATDSQASVAFLAVDADVETVYAMWSRLSDGDLMKRVRTNGTGWGTETIQWASGGQTGWYIYSDVITEGSEVKLVYTYDQGTHVDDASNITYNEEVLRTLAAGGDLVQAADTHTAAALTGAKAGQAGQPSDAHTAQPVLGAKAGTALRATSTDTAQPVTGAKAGTLAQTVETATAQPVTGGKTAVLTAAVDTHTAATLTGASGSSGTLAQTVDASTAQPVTGAKAGPAGQAADTHTAAAVSGAKTATLTLVVDTQLAQPVTGAKTGPAGQVADTHTAAPMTGATAGMGVLTQVVDTETALPLTGTKAATLTEVVEASNAQAMAGLRAILLTRALDDHTAHPLTGVKAGSLAQVLEPQVALTMVGIAAALGVPVAAPSLTLTSPASTLTITSPPSTLEIT